MKKALLALLFVSSLAHADWRDPFEKFDTGKNFTNQTHLTWVTVDDPTKACAAERSRRGFAQYSGKVMACSFWEQNQCTIITAKFTDRDTIGHELQHCFQGNWH